VEREPIETLNLRLDPPRVGANRCSFPRECDYGLSALFKELLPGIEVSLEIPMLFVPCDLAEPILPLPYGHDAVELLAGERGYPAFAESSL
jgi:hypothetical protein